MIRSTNQPLRLDAQHMLKDLLRLDTIPQSDLLRLIEMAVDLKHDFDRRAADRPLSGRRIALIVDDGGWRNTTALAAGMSALGAECTQVPVSLSGKEAVGDLAKYLDNWFDLIAIRTPSLETLAELAGASKRPVMNLRTRDNHPFEILGDLSFVKHRRGTIDNLVIAAVAPADNIIHSWAEAAQALPLQLVQVAPRAAWIDRRRFGAGAISFTEDMGALVGADVIITDCRPKAALDSTWDPYQITGSVLDSAKTGVMFIPCPPVTRGAEVSTDAMLHSSCMCFDAKSFLIHAQNAFVIAALAP